MAQRVWRSDDSDPWLDGLGTSVTDTTVSSSATATLANASCSGTATSTTLTLGSASTFSNGDIVWIQQMRGTSVGKCEINKISSGGGTTTLTMAYSLTNTYTDSGNSQAQIVGFITRRNYTINSGVTLTIPAWDMNVGGILPIMCNDTFTLNGTISGVGLTGQNNVDEADGGHGCGYWGGKGQNTIAAYTGEGTTGDRVRQTTANGNGGGGAFAQSGSANKASGGGGGNGTAGTDGSQVDGVDDTKGSGAGSVGSASLVDIFMGGGGGGASVGQGGSALNGPGGGGGIAIVFANIITINGTTGLITVNGGIPGTGGQVSGGGGAGGSVLLKALTTATLGTNRITATGGSGNSGSAGLPSGNGGSGRIHLDYAGTYSGSTNPTIDVTNDTSLTGGSFVPKFIFF